ncbi:ArnT family glycosyltransferase [Hymenobacter sp. CRA2]|uniref:ArnT family glycosyltransferase n=1 Tax=Hymenobacter sp. CRA2 TaxID=1955620 RepID=UPI00098FB0B9|nr:glycosyltransferase family 39 protein [Hymenobacter sp. CRA2]OON67335.1 hypothetical protein B0919_17835 [Hymenobacter sp. CRA2]
MGPSSKRLPADRWLLAILALGLLLRLAFWWKGATIYYGAGQEHYNGDSFSFIESFMNWWRSGQYTLEPLIPDAAFGRLPGYPFFYGLHYVLFGPQRVAAALTATQILCDTGTIALLYYTLRRWTGGATLAPRLVALLYAAYPFAIVWVTVVGSETMNTFCTVLWLNVITARAHTRRHYLLVGLLTAAAFYVREFMGILLPISLLFVWLWPAEGALLRRWQRPAWVMLGFLLLYAGWPLRNYINYGRWVFVKPVAAGYANQREDMQAYLDWLHCWTNDNTTWVEGLVRDVPLHYPGEIFQDATEERRAYALTALAARCGSSFHLRRLDTHEYRLVLPERFANCNAQVAAGFDSLRRSYIRRQPVAYYTAVPTANLVKAFFKTATVHQVSSGKLLIQRVLFLYRTLLLLVGAAGLLAARRQALFGPVAAYFLFIYFYVSFDFRSLEMRYLLQADVLLLLPAAWLLARVAARLLPLRLARATQVP